MRARTTAAVLALVLAAPARPDPPALRYDAPTDVAVTAGASLLWLGTELARRRLAPSACRWCGEDALDAGARDALLWRHPDRAARASDVLAFGLVPAGVVAHQLLAARAAGSAREGLVDVLVVAEAAALSMDLNQLVKYAAGRQRPFVHHAPAGRAPDPDDNTSFTSGHATIAFTLAGAAGTVSDLRRYPGAPWVWAVGMTAAGATAYLRVAADRHYLTDVLAGAAAGAALGWALPWTLHRPGAEGASRPAVVVTPVPLGVAIAF